MARLWLCPKSLFFSLERSTVLFPQLAGQKGWCLCYGFLFASSISFLGKAQQRRRKKWKVHDVHRFIRMGLGHVLGFDSWNMLSGPQHKEPQISWHSTAHFRQILINVKLMWNKKLIFSLSDHDFLIWAELAWNKIFCFNFSHSKPNNIFSFHGNFYFLFVFFFFPTDIYLPCWQIPAKF